MIAPGVFESTCSCFESLTTSFRFLSPSALLSEPELVTDPFCGFCCRRGGDARRVTFLTAETSDRGERAERAARAARRGEEGAGDRGGRGEGAGAGA